MFEDVLSAGPHMHLGTASSITCISPSYQGFVDMLTGAELKRAERRDQLKKEEKRPEASLT